MKPVQISAKELKEKGIVVFETTIPPKEKKQIVEEPISSETPTLPD